MSGNTTPSSMQELTRPLGYELVTDVLGEVAPAELSLMSYVLDDLYSAAERGTPVSASDERAFGLGGPDLLALVIIPLIVNVISNLISDYLKQRAFSSPSVSEIQQIGWACGVSLSNKKAEKIRDAIIHHSQSNVPIVAEELRGALRQLLLSRFSEEELRNLVFDLGIDWDVLPGGAKGDKIRELILFLERRKALMTLVSYIHTMRPDIPMILEFVALGGD